MPGATEREIKFYCLYCLQPSYQPRPEIDFEEMGNIEISVCGECLRKGEADEVINLIAAELKSINRKIIERRMKDVLEEYRQDVIQGS